MGSPNEEDLKIFGNYKTSVDIENGMAKLNLGAKSDEGSLQREQEDETGDEDDELITIGLFLKPGDVVQISRPGREAVLAVYVQQFGIESQLFSANGRWCHVPLRYIAFAIPKCIDPALVRPLVPFLPTDPTSSQTNIKINVPREIAAPVRMRLEQLRHDSEKIYKENASVLDNAYLSLADPARARVMTLAQIAKSLLGSRDPVWSPGPAAFLAVRNALYYDGFRFHSDERSQRMTNVVLIRPKNDVGLVETVHDWIRQYTEYQASNANASIKKDDRHIKGHRTERRTERSIGATNIADFVEKARRLIAVSRKSRDILSGSLGPSKFRTTVRGKPSANQISWGEEFTGADKQILNFLLAWTLSGQFMAKPELHSACAALVQAIGCYDPDIYLTRSGIEKIDRQACHLLLQEIGVIAPFENRAIHDEQLMLPTMRLTRNVELLHQRAEAFRRSPDFRDSMADLRRDWGTMNVYCIDDAGANEIDDGVSISRVSGKESEVWIHVHVANPTAFFEKTHVLSALAAHLTETVYTPERTYPMLPSWVTQSHFSLDCNRPVITFSTRLDIASASILETKVTHGIINNITNITPAELARHLGESDEIDIIKFVVGGEVPAHDAQHGRRTSLSPEQLKELQTLYAAARALWKIRRDAGGVAIGGAKYEARVFETQQLNGLIWSPPSTDRARYIHGDPIIEVKARVAKNSAVIDMTANNIVEELMLTACQCAASWCAERNIPAMYRGTTETPVSEIRALEEFKREVVLPYLAKHGRLSRSLGFKYIDALGRSITHSSPLPHKLVGAKSYLKVTSPLRRFSDMISHWQIEAALRYEARTGKRLNLADEASSSRSILPFTQRQIQEAILTLSPRERIITVAKKYSMAHWAVSAFMRAHVYKEAPLPETFKVWIRFPTPTQKYAEAFLSDYGLQVRMRKLAEFNYEVGDEFEATIFDVNVYRRSIIMTPIRLLHRDVE